MPDFFRFPSTPHIDWLSPRSARMDKVMSSVERQKFLSGQVTIEEKVDGANVGISWDDNKQLRVQNRGSYIATNSGTHPQFERLWPWIYERYHLFESWLPDTCIVFGEWCAFKHSQHYTQLPDWFIGFDVYDKAEAKFFSKLRRDALFKKLEIVPVVNLNLPPVRPKLLSALEQLPSAYGCSEIEGLYLRKDNTDWLSNRAKLVRAEFMQAIETHWKKQKPVQNRLLSE